MKTIMLVLVSAMALTVRAEEVKSIVDARDHLKSLKTSYDRHVEDSITKPHKEAVTKLNAGYSKSLARELDVATKAGNLPLAVAIKEEMARVGSGQALPQDDKGTPEPLARLRSAYSGELRRLEAKRDADALTPLKKYEEALVRYRDSLTLTKLLDAAVVVQEAIDALKPAVVEKKDKDSLPMRWSYYSDRTMSAKMGDLTLSPDGSFELMSWDGKNVNKGKWKKGNDGAIEMTMTGAARNESVGFLYVSGDTAVWSRAIGDRFLSAAKAP